MEQAETCKKDTLNIHEEDVACTVCRDMGQRGWCGSSGDCWLPMFVRDSAKPSLDVLANMVDTVISIEVRIERRGETETDKKRGPST